MSEFVSFFLLGLQYCAGAFGMIVVAVVIGSIAYWLFRLVYGQSLGNQSDEEAGAPEGDSRQFRREDY
ncbi:hypothetical protein G6L15_08435 [Agrobacterium rhizogenes]|uniref:hypothetical protein n=1 Tax=Rhizobium rhizogenes TaxID=359 RepID=UPI001572D081|nr:hypothetical protein [Rhizobium rhizogenes]NTG86172.1 hypothetical protein [Rhizobium rhizogenes]